MEIGLRLNQLKNIVKPQNAAVTDKNTTDPNAPKLNVPLEKDTISFIGKSDIWKDGGKFYRLVDGCVTEVDSENEQEQESQKIEKKNQSNSTPQSSSCDSDDSSSSNSSNDSQWTFESGGWFGSDKWIHKETGKVVHREEDLNYYANQIAEEKSKAKSKATLNSKLTHEEGNEIEHQIQSNNDVKSPRGLIEKVVGRDGKLEPTNTGTNKKYMKVNDDLGVLEMDRTAFQEMQKTNEKLRRKGINELTQPIIDYKVTSDGRYQVLTTHKGSSLKDERENLSVKETQEVVKQIREINSKAADKGVVVADAGNPGNYTISRDKNGNIKVSMIDVTPSDSISTRENESKISYMAEKLMKGSHSNENSGRVQGGSKKVKDINAMLRSNRDESYTSTSSSSYRANESYNEAQEQARYEDPKTGRLKKEEVDKFRQQCAAEDSAFKRYLEASKAWNEGGRKGPQPRQSDYN